MLGGVATVRRTCRGSGATSTSWACRSPAAGAANTTIVRVRPDGTELRFGLDGSDRFVAACGVAAGTAIAKDIRLAELLIAKQTTPDPAALADPSVNFEEPVDGLNRDT